MTHARNEGGEIQVQVWSAKRQTGATCHPKNNMTSKTSRPGPEPDYSHTHTIRYSEMDGQGVVFNSHYQAFCDVVLDLWVRDKMGKAWSLSTGMDFSMVGGALNHTHQRSATRQPVMTHTTRST